VTSQSVSMDKREQILESALKLFVEFGFHGAPTSKIAQNAGVSNGTLFHYFKTKDELVVELYIKLKNELNSSMSTHLRNDDSIKNRFKKTFTIAIQWALDNRDKFYYIQQIYFTPHIYLIPESVQQEQMRMHKKLIEEALTAKAIKNMPVDFITALFSSHLTGIYNYIQTLPESKRKSIIDNGFELFWDMMERK
jgi:AcrR family transcriptional regulator